MTEGICNLFKNVPFNFSNHLYISQDKVKNLSHDLGDLEKELDSMKPPGREIKLVKQQLDDIGKYYKRLETADDMIGDTERAAQSLVDSGYAVDSTKTRDQVCN